MNKSIIIFMFNFLYDKKDIDSDVQNDCVIESDDQDQHIDDEEVSM